jgi:uncharacterized protein (TIGR00369 family)
MSTAIHPYIRKILEGEHASSPIGATLGMKIVSLDPEAGHIEAQYQGTAEFLNPAGQIQGGMLASMLDDVTALLTLASLKPDQYCATLNLNVTYLRSAVPGLITGRATLVKRGAHICNASGELWQNGKLVTTASAVLMVMQQG